MRHLQQGKNNMIKTLRALIVDDSEDDTLLIARELRHSGYEVVFDRVDTPHGMKDALEHKQWDVILVDYKMPHFTGIEALKIAREKNPDIPFILVSGVIVEEMVVEAMRRGANDCIKKDNIERLTPTIARELEAAQEKRERKNAEKLLEQKNIELSEANRELIQLNSELEKKNRELAVINNQLESANNQLIESRSEVVEKNEMLNENRRKLSTLIANLPGIAYRCLNNKDWTMEFISSGCFFITGYNEEDLIGNNKISFNEIIYEEDRSIVSQQIQDALSRSESFEIRYRLVTKDGNIVWVWDKGRGITDGKGDNTIIEGFITDITDLVRKDEQIRQIQKMEIIGTLAGGIAHDFNNILGGIIGSVDLVAKILDREELNESAQIDKYLYIIKNASTRASDLINKLLILSRKHELKLSPVDINNSILNVFNICSSSFPKCIDINVSYNSKPAIVMADPTHIEQVILNLCVNASHAMTIMRDTGEPEGGTLHIGIKKGIADSDLCRRHPDAREGCSYYIIQVSDTGVGIDQTKIQTLFETFFSTKKDGMGTGLGLSIVSSIVKQYDGFIDVVSEHGKGTTFFVYIPLSQQSESVQEADKTEKVQYKGNGVILVVDDEEIMLAIIEGALKESGYSVITASDGKSALEIFSSKNREIDAILLDMSMPGLSGKDIYSRFKEIKPDAKVILSSGYKDTRQIKEMIALGVDAFIPKPFDLNFLVHTVKEIIENK